MNWYKIYRHIHDGKTNYHLSDQLKKIGRENFWIGYDDEPRNLVEDYLQKLYKRFFIKPCLGMEYWVYIPPDGHTYTGPHWDSDESIEEKIHPEWVGVVDLYNSCSGLMLNDMKYGDIKANKVLWVYQEEAKLTLFRGEYSYMELPNVETNISLYFDVWTDRRPSGLGRSTHLDWDPPTFKQLIRKQKPIEYEGDVTVHTHTCGDKDFDYMTFHEPTHKQEALAYLVSEEKLSTKG